MWTDEQFDELEQEEHSLTEEAIIALLLLLNITRANLEKELRSFYQKYGKDGVITYQEARKWVSVEDHRKRLSVLLLFINDELDMLHIKLNPKFSTFLDKVVNKEIDFFDVDLDVEDILATHWGIDDSLWSMRLADDVDLWKAYLGTDLKRSMLRRDSIDEVIEQLNKRFMSFERILKRLGLTESTAVGSLARKEIFKELGIKKYRFYAREDERTCEHCGSLHGLTFPMTAYEVGATASPIHSHCRCWEVPITE